MKNRLMSTNKIKVFDFVFLFSKNFVMIMTSILILTRIGFAGLLPSAKSSLSNDPLVIFQWALKTEGQYILRDVTDITHSKVTALMGASADIDADPIKLSANMKKTVVVAVLDSGIDLKHPDLIESLFHNEAECINGRIPFLPTQDKDNNGYIGDCIGWNFTVPDGDNRQNNPEDDLGHGTHVAGIIAAAIQNQLGVSGVAGKIKILPLKVTSATENNQHGGSASSANIILTRRVIKAIQYATKMKVDVINVSLGWPFATDKPELRVAFQNALDAGITIVAAGGNNNNTSFNFPCSYPGIICVAANGIDNQLTSFSNFGGHIDIAAPGEEILSTYPTYQTPMNFSIAGYESLNGTSQAAPFVSAAVAVLKGVYPKIDENEVRARLFLGAQDLTPSEAIAKAKFTQFGTLKIQRSIDLQEQALVTPQFKKLSQVIFQSGQSEIQFNLEFLNYWQEQSHVHIQVRSLSPGIEILKGGEVTLDFLRGQSRILSLLAQLKNPMVSKEVKIEVLIQWPNGKLRSFFHVFDLSRQVEGDALAQHIPVHLIEGIKSADVIKSILTVSDPLDISENPSYYWSQLQSDGLKIHLLQNNEISFLDTLVPVPTKSTNLLNFTKIPLGASYGYWVGTLGLSEDGTSQVMHYQTLDAHLVGSGLAQAIEFTPETVVLDKNGFNSLHFTSQRVAEKFQEIIPIFITEGHIPKADINPDPFQFENNTTVRRVFYLEPILEKNKWVYRTRNFDNFAFQAELRQILNLNYQDELNLVGFLPQSKLDGIKIRILYSYGSHAMQKFVVVETQGDWLSAHQFHLVSATYQSAFISYGSMAPVMELFPEPLKNAGASFAVIYTPTKAQNIFFNPTGTQIEGEFQLTSLSPQDLLMGFLQSFHRQNEYFTFVQSKSNLILQIDSSAGTSKRQQVSTHRATWPGLDFGELLYPAYIKSATSWNPAIYVDSTQMYSNNIYFWVVDQEDNLVAPAAFNFSIPDRCRPLVPQKFKAFGGVYGSVLACETPSHGLELQILPVTF